MDMELGNQQNPEKVIKAKLMELELLAMKYEGEINTIVKQIYELEKDNRKYQAENNAEKSDEITAKIQQLRTKIKDINKQKEEALGVELNLTFRDDFAINKKVDL